MTIIANELVNGIKLPIKDQYPFLVVGSAALPFCTGNDIDIICSRDAPDTRALQATNWTEDSMKGRSCLVGGQRVEFIYAEQHKVLQQMLDKYAYIYPSFNSSVCYILKAAHIHIDRKGKSWEKDIHDFHILKAISDVYFGRSVFHHEDCKALQQFNSEIHNVHTMSLNQTKEQFFDDGVVKYIDHDRLHEVFAHNDVPIYTLTQQSGQPTVACDRQKFHALEWDEQLQMALEETYVIAAERFVIPYHIQDKFHNISRKDVNTALKKVCTTLSSGWFREFCIYNYYNLFNMIDMKYYTDILKDKVFKEL